MTISWSAIKAGFWIAWELIVRKLEELSLRKPIEKR